MPAEAPSKVAMPEHLVRFRYRDWAPLIDPEPANWGGRRLGTPWALFKAHSMYMQARWEWRRNQPRNEAREEPRASLANDAP